MQQSFGSRRSVSLGVSLAIAIASLITTVACNDGLVSPVPSVTRVASPAIQNSRIVEISPDVGVPRFKFRVVSGGLRSQTGQVIKTPVAYSQRISAAFSLHSRLKAAAIQAAQVRAAALKTPLGQALVASPNVKAELIIANPCAFDADTWCDRERERLALALGLPAPVRSVPSVLRNGRVMALRAPDAAYTVLGATARRNDEEAGCIQIADMLIASDIRLDELDYFIDYDFGMLADPEENQYAGVVAYYTWDLWHDGGLLDQWDDEQATNTTWYNLMNQYNCWWAYTH